MNVIWQEAAKFTGIHFVSMRRCSKYFHSLFDPAKSRFMWKRAVQQVFWLLYYDNHTQASLEMIDFEFKLTSYYRELADQFYRDACLKNRFEVANWISRRFNIDEDKVRTSLMHAIEQGRVEVVRCILLSCKENLEIYAFQQAMNEQQISILDWLQKSSAVWNYMSKFEVYILHFKTACINGSLQTAKWISQHYYISKTDMIKHNILLLVDMQDHLDLFYWIRQKWVL